MWFNGQTWNTGQPCVFARNQDGQLEAFETRGGQSNASHTYQFENWSDWTLMGESQPAASLQTLQGSNLAVARHGDGRLEAFLIGTDYQVYHNWQNAAPRNHSHSGAGLRRARYNTHSIAIPSNELIDKGELVSQYPELNGFLDIVNRR